MVPERITPPQIADVRRPHLSASRVAGMLKANIRMAETPEARKDAVCEGMPAWAKMVGAYCKIRSVCGEFTSLRRTTYVEYAVDAAQLNERQDKHRETCLRSVFALKDQA